MGFCVNLLRHREGIAEVILHLNSDQVMRENSPETKLKLFFCSILVHKGRIEEKLNKFARKRALRTFIQFHSGSLTVYTNLIFGMLYICLAR